LDTLLGPTFLSEPLIVAGILVLAIIGAAVTLGLRQQAQDQTSATQN
jgi:uncharacterized membrane protein